MKEEATPKEKTKALQIRMPESMLEKIRQMAEKEDRSMNFIVVRELTEKLSQNAE